MVAPVLDWDDETDDLTPDFLVDFAEDDVVEGNEVALKIYSNSALTHLVASLTHELTEAEILAGTIDFGASALADNWTYYAKVRVESGSWSNTETIVLGDGVSGTEPAFTLEGVTAPSGAGIWFGRGPEEEWKRRRKKLKELEELVARASGQIPDDVPESRVVKEAARKVEAAADALEATPPRAPVLPPLDTAALVAAVNSIQRALRDYKARRLEELAEDDDEEILLLLDD